MLPGIMGAIGGLSGYATPVTLINRGSLSTSASNLTAYTFSSYGIGTASGTRRVIAYVAGISSTTGSRTLSSATIGGVSATIDVQQTAGIASSYLSAIISATVPSGTTADIVLTFSGAMTSAAVAAVAVDGLTSVTPYETVVDISDPNEVDIDWFDGGFVIGGSVIASSSANCSWTGLTERSESSPESGADVVFADLFPTSTATSQHVQADWSSGSYSTMAVASYR